MACWQVFVKNDSSRSISLVGGVGDALVAGIISFGHSVDMIIRQTSMPEARGTDGVDGYGRDVRMLLHTSRFSCDGNLDDEDGRVFSEWLSARRLSSDRYTKKERCPESGKCKCSRCGDLVLAGEKNVGFRERRKHYVYHLSCLGVDVVL